MTLDFIIEELRKFSDKIIDFGFPINDHRIELFEEHYKITFPLDFKAFMKAINGVNLMGSEIYAFDIDKPNSIENIYIREHFQVVIPQYKYLVPFSTDGRGDFYCINTENDYGTIVFWVSNYQYSNIDLPEVVNDNFLDWVKEVLLDWTLEDYNYDGTDK